MLWKVIELVNTERTKSEEPGSDSSCFALDVGLNRDPWQYIGGVLLEEIQVAFGIGMEYQTLVVSGSR